MFIHLFFQGKEKVTDHEIIPLIKRTLDRKDPRNWYYALMDYGSALRNLIDNPNRKSAQYKKQSPFAGSDRQIRGKILRMLSEQRNVTVKIASEHLGISHKKFELIVDQLCREGFIRKKGAHIRMA